KQASTFRKGHAGSREALADAADNRDGLGGRAIVVADQSIEAVRVRANDRNGLVRTLERKEVVFVLEQNQRFLRSTKRQLAMGGSVILSGCDFRIGHSPWWVKQTQAESRRKQAFEGEVKVRLGKQSLLNSLDRTLAFVLNAVLR